MPLVDGASVSYLNLIVEPVGQSAEMLVIRFGAAAIEWNSIRVVRRRDDTVRRDPP
jgi:hypothetical protein